VPGCLLIQLCAAHAQGSAIPLWLDGVPGARTNGSDEAVGVFDTPLKSTPWKDMLRAIRLARRRAVADANRHFIPWFRLLGTI
jgi:hypothetical protein